MLADLLTVAAVGATVTISAGLYFLPVVVGALRRAPDLGSVAVLDVLLGWTLIGWVVALALALRSRPPGQVLQLVQNLPPAPLAGVSSGWPPAGELPLGWAGPSGLPRSGPEAPGWAGPPGPPPPRPDSPPPLLLPPDPAGTVDGYGPLGEE